MIYDSSIVRLGKAPAKEDPRTFRAASLLSPLTITPDVTDYGRKTPATGVKGNDQYGDCVVVDVARSQELWTANTGAMREIPAADCIDTYMMLSGGKDEGLVVLDTLKYWRNRGLFGNKLEGFALVDTKSPTEIHKCQLVFGTIFTGFGLPKAWQWKDVWDVVEGEDGEPWSWGGHAMAVEAVTPEGLWVYTWGYRQFITFAAVAKYADELYAMISPLFLPGGLAPNGFNRQALVDRLAAL